MDADILSPGILLSTKYTYFQYGPIYPVTVISYILKSISLSVTFLLD
jgi:hypothetical protein